MALYIVSTPIGNLQDMTFRAIETLQQVDIIAAEDTRTAGNLLRHFDIQKKLTSFHSYSSSASFEALCRLLSEGKNIALVSEAGTPCISDPGFRIVSWAVQNNVQVIPIPGPSAFLAALSASGFPTHAFEYLGFIPHKKGRKTFMEYIAHTNKTLVFYESCHRIKKMITEACTFDFGERKWCIGRELTKKFETFYRGTIHEIARMEILDKGEFTVVVAPIDF